MKQAKMETKSKILIVGDVVLDHRVQCDVNRISPEAPIPVALVTEKSAQLGGAANVAQFLARWFKEVELLSIVGADAAADTLKCMCENANIQTFFRYNKAIPTTQKTRITSGAHQLIRIDEEQKNYKDETSVFIEEIQRNSASIDFLILSDYDKGALMDPKKLIEAANKVGISSIVDPKGSDFTKYAGAFVLKPNELEARAGFDVPNCTEQFYINKIQEFRKKHNIENILVTSGSEGIFLFNGIENGTQFRQEKIDVTDVTGAGDTVCAGIAIGLSVGFSIRQCCELGNLLGFEAVKTTGNFIANKDQIARLLNLILKNNNEKVVFTNGCFDILHVGHLDFLKECSRLGNKLIVGLNSDKSVRRIKGEGRPVNSAQIRKAALQLLPFISEVIEFDEEIPLNLVKKIKPDVLVKGADYNSRHISGREVVEKYGGTVKIINFKYDISTTKIIEKLRDLNEK